MADTPTFSYNRDQTIRRSLRQCGAVFSGETPGAQEISDAADALNAMVAEWQARGIHVWKEKEGTLFLQPSVYNYGLGPTKAASVCQTASLLGGLTANVTLTAGTNIVPLSPGFGLSSDFNADYNSAFGGVAPINVGDNFGVMMSNNQLFWSTVTAYGSGQVTLKNALPYVVNPQANAFDYAQLNSASASACAIYRPLRVLNVRRILWSSLIETMVTPMARLDYRNQPNKSQTGVVTQFYYDPQLGTGQFWAWPNPVDSLNGLNFTYMEPIYDFNTAADYPDFPQEWVNTIVWNLANEIMLEYDVGGERAARIEKRAMETLDLVSGWDREPESYFLGINFDQTMR